MRKPNSHQYRELQRLRAINPAQLALFCMIGHEIGRGIAATLSAPFTLITPLWMIFFKPWITIYTAPRPQAAHNQAQLEKNLYRLSAHATGSFSRDVGGVKQALSTYTDSSQWQRHVRKKCLQKLEHIEQKINRLTPH